MDFAVTGHRDVLQEAGELERFARLSVDRMVQAGATRIITGMARGWDLEIARACWAKKIPFLAAIPFVGQEEGWPAAEQAEYRRILSYTMDPKFGNHFILFGRMRINRYYIVRDEWMVDNSVELWALDSGRKSGTHTTVLYAEKQQRKIVPLWQDWLEFRRKA